MIKALLVLVFFMLGLLSGMVLASILPGEYSDHNEKPAPSEDLSDLFAAKQALENARHSYTVGEQSIHGHQQAEEQLWALEEEYQQEFFEMINNGQARHFLEQGCTTVEELIPEKHPNREMYLELLEYKVYPLIDPQTPFKNPAVYESEAFRSGQPFYLYLFNDPEDPNSTVNHAVIGVDRPFTQRDDLLIRISPVFPWVEPENPQSLETALKFFCDQTISEAYEFLTPHGSQVVEATLDSIVDGDYSVEHYAGNRGKILAWVAQNITYDESNRDHVRHQHEPAAATLISGKGVCINYCRCAISLFETLEEKTFHENNAGQTQEKPETAVEDFSREQALVERVIRPIGDWAIPANNAGDGGGHPGGMFYRASPGTGSIRIDPLRRDFGAVVMMRVSSRRVEPVQFPRLEAVIYIPQVIVFPAGEWSMVIDTTQRVVSSYTPANRVGFVEFIKVTGLINGPPALGVPEQKGIS